MVNVLLISSRPAWRQTRLSAKARHPHRQQSSASAGEFQEEAFQAQMSLWRLLLEGALFIWGMHSQFANMHQYSHTDKCEQGFLVWCVQHRQRWTGKFDFGFLQWQGHLHYGSLLKNILDWMLLLRRPLQFKFRKNILSAFTVTVIFFQFAVGQSPNFILNHVFWQNISFPQVWKKTQTPDK